MERQELQKLRDLPIEGVAERLGLRVERHKCLCPFHDDHTPSLTFKNNKFRCFACGEHGGTIDLALKLLPLGGGGEGGHFLEACRWLANSSALSIPSIQNNQNNQKTPRPPFDSSRYARYFEHPFLSPEARHFLFDERRLDPRVVRWCRLNSFRDKQGIPWLQIPYYDQQGKLVGIQNRNLETNSDSKTPSDSPLKGEKAGDSSAKDSLPLREGWGGSSSLPLREGRGGSSSLPLREGRGGSGAGRGGSPRFRFPAGSRCGIYNLPVLNLLKPGEPLYIAEGCSDCWSLLSAGHKAIAIPSATLLTRKDIELLKGLSSSPYGETGRGLFHMYPDRDTPGERLFLQLQEILPNLEHHQLPPDCKDFSDYYLKSRPPLTASVASGNLLPFVEPEPHSVASLKTPVAP